MPNLVDAAQPKKINWNKINFAVWRARLTLALGYLFAAAAALENGVAGLPPLLPMLPENTRHGVAAAVAVLLTLQAVQTRVQHPLTTQGVPPTEESKENAGADAQTGNHAGDAGSVGPGPGGDGADRSQNGA